MSNPERGNTAEPFTVLLVGAGGREHAIAWKLSKSPMVKHLFVAPGNSGTATLGANTTNVPLDVMAFDKLVSFAVQNDVGLVAVGPELPLVHGIADTFKKVGIPVFGPSKKAAQIEGSKAFSKEFMRRNNIPTAGFETFTAYDQAVAYVESVSHNVVIKASGLAAGKGVLIPQSKAEALEAVASVMRDKAFGDAGHEVVIEECLEGQELSILAFTDGYSIIPCPASQDHKRAHDGDQGPNTGGMGAYGPAPIATKEMMTSITKSILKPTVDAMRREGFPFVGCLYAGLMVTPSGVKVLEYNCRFGDPETQVLVPLLSDDTDLAEVMLACAEHRLDSVRLAFKNAHAATVVVAAGGYPGKYPTGRQITLSPTPANVTIFHAGAALDSSGRLIATGGRVLAVTGICSTLELAVKAVYEGVKSIHFEGMFYRKDIAYRALSTSQKGKTTYADAGVSIDAGNLLVEKIKPMVKTTARLGSDSEIGGFGGLFDLKCTGFTDPILVAATDGVGTKLIVAHNLGVHDTIGIDLVAMNVNDLVVQGAEPLLFLDYYACGRLEVDVCADVVKGIVDGCKEARCALVGGETAEMPGLYKIGDYDVAGFALGAVERSGILPRSTEMVAGDLLLGIPSSGVHSNGYSLVRRVVADSDCTWTSLTPFEHEKATLGEALLTPTRIYVRQVMPLLRERLVKGIAHITGGGFVENLPRVLPNHLGGRINAASYVLPPVFRWLMKTGNVEGPEMLRTFNCGVGMILVVAAKDAEATIKLLNENGEPVIYALGYLHDKAELDGKEVVVDNLEAWEA